MNMGELKRVFARSKRVVNAAENSIDRTHQSGGRAVVGIKRMTGQRVDRIRGVASEQIGIQIGATKTVNRLFGVANHHQGVAVIRLTDLVNTIQTLVLPRVGVLELIDHGDGVLLSYGRCQLALVRVQCMVKSL